MSYEPPQPPANGPAYPPPPPGAQPPPPGHVAWPPPVPPKKKGWGPVRITMAIVGGLLALCLIGAIRSVSSGSDDSNAAPTADDISTTSSVKPQAKSAPKAKAPAAGIGDPVRDGKFEFVVSGVDCSKSVVGNQYLNEKAQGKFCVVSMSVKNIGSEPQLFAGGNQKAYDGAGSEFTNNTTAELYANDSNETFLNDINPGNRVKGKVVFDVPESTTLTTVELHDSIWSGGVKVNLK